MAMHVAWYAAMNPGDEPARSDADAHARSLGGYTKYFKMGETIPGLGKAAEAGWAVYGPQSSGGGPQGTAGGGTPPSQPPAQSSGIPGMTPMMANPPQATGGGQGFNRSPNQVILDLPPQRGDWLGLEALIPDNRIPANKSPRVTNWDRFARYGSRCVRRGVAKLTDDITNVDDAQQASATAAMIAKASFTASTDWMQVIDPDGETYAFWFDKTGADTEPAGSQAADNSFRVNISTDTTAAEVGARLVTAVTAAAITGLTASGTTTVTFAVTVGGDHWRIEEFVTSVSFTVTPFTYTGGSALSSQYRGLGFVHIPSNAGDQLIEIFRDKDVEIGEVVGAEAPTSMHLCDPGPLWGRPPHLDGLRGPDFVLSEPSANVIRVTAEFLAIAQVPLKKQTVKAITIRYRGPFTDDGKTHYPLDPDESTERSTVLVRREAWDGVSDTWDTPAITAGAGRYFFAAWVHALEGTTELAQGSWSL
jgi:hypothetical protein